MSLTIDGESQHAKLSPADRRLATTLVYGVLKGQARLDHALAAYAPRGIAKLDGPTLDLLRLGALQILELRIPPHAAVDGVVSALRQLRGAKLAGFANGLLRKLAQEGAPPAPAKPVSTRLSVLTGAPLWVVDAAIARVGVAEAGALLEAEGKPAPVWLRVNRRRVTDVTALVAQLAEALPRATIDVASVRLGAVRVTGADGVFDTLPYVTGLVTAQDLGAQLVGELLGAQPGETVLDACSGIGGKSTFMAEAMDDRGVVDAADSSARKLDLGADHVRRLGLSIVHKVVTDLTRSDGKGLRERYDRVLLDAPCSGLGVARRHPEVRLRKYDSDRPSLISLQARLLDALAARVKPGGVLVYAVCTYTEEEGPEQIRAFLARHREFQRDGEDALPEPMRGRAEIGELRTWPHRDDADGFFAARLRRLP